MTLADSNPELYLPMMTLIGFTVPKPDHPVLKHVCPLK